VKLFTPMLKVESACRSPMTALYLWVALACVPAAKPEESAARFDQPPGIAECTPAVTFEYPPQIVERQPLATFRYPPTTVADGPFATFSVPPATVA